MMRCLHTLDLSELLIVFIAFSLIQQRNHLFRVQGRRMIGCKQSDAQRFIAVVWEPGCIGFLFAKLLPLGEDVF